MNNRILQSCRVNGPYSVVTLIQPSDDGYIDPWGSLRSSVVKNVVPRASSVC